MRRATFRKYRNSFRRRPANTSVSCDSDNGGADSSLRDALEGERKTVTALFADIKGSTELMGTSTPRKRARLSTRRCS